MFHYSRERVNIANLFVETIRYIDTHSGYANNIVLNISIIGIIKGFP